MVRYEPTYKPYGETSILIEWPSQISPEIIQDITVFNDVLRKQQKVKETIVAYNSILVQISSFQNYSLHYKHRKDFERFTEKFQQLYHQEREIKSSRKKCWEIPVCYDIEFGIDLEEISKAKNLSIEKVVELHSQTEYLIYFLGFQPGFLYLGGLNPDLHTPRKANPRLRIEKGSVGIGGEQTGVYPQDSAGGWNIIGRSPINFFDPTKSKPCFAKAGEKVKFVSIEKDDFYHVAKEVNEENYQLKYSWI
jgi:inhibitor of KinA